MPDRPEQVLCFDYGLRFCGVAIGNTLSGSARPLNALKMQNGTPRWPEIGELIAEWQPNRLLVGKPLNMDGSESDMSQRAARFSRRLEGRYQLPVECFDERLSSHEARGELLAEGQRDFKTAGVDSLSAALIFESWLRSRADSGAS